MQKCGYRAVTTPLTGEEFPKSSNTSNQARADVSAGGLLSIDGQTDFCCVRVFNPLARCHLHHSLPVLHKKNEKEKKRDCNQPILQVEYGSFTPLVFTWFGGMSRECSHFFSHTANRKKEPKSKISAWIKANLNFAFIWSMLLCLQGTKTPSNVDNISEIDMCAIVAETNIQWITYKFIPCYFTTLNMYGYIFIWPLFRYFLYLYPVIRWYGIHIFKNLFMKIWKKQYMKKNKQLVSSACERYDFSENKNLTSNSWRWINLKTLCGN